MDKRITVRLTSEYLEMIDYIRGEMVKEAVEAGYKGMISDLNDSEIIRFCLHSIAYDKGLRKGGKK